MKPLFSALLEMIVLVVSILLVMLCAKLLKFDSSFDNYSEKYPDSIITVGNAMDYFPEGTDPTPEEASVLLGKEWFGEACYMRQEKLYHVEFVLSRAFLHFFYFFAGFFTLLPAVNQTKLY